MHSYPLVLALLIWSASVQAADRVVTVTSFDRIRVDGPYQVEIITGRGSSAKITGDRAAIDRVDMDVQGTMLTIRTNRTAWAGGWPGDAKNGPVIIRLTAGELRGATISGSGSLKIDRVRGPRISLAVDGSARMTVGRVETDRLELVAVGSGALSVSGITKALTATVRGSGAIEGAGLTTSDLILTSESAGNVALGAKLTAKVVSTGSGSVTIGGQPACTVNALGSGEVVCGS